MAERTSCGARFSAAKTDMVRETRSFGNASTPVQVVGPANFYPYDVPSLPDLARSDAFPTVATDGSGRILLAFQAYSDAAGFMAAPSLANTPRIFLTYSTNAGSSWSIPRAVDYGPNVNTFQFMPRIAVGRRSVRHSVL